MFMAFMWIMVCIAGGVAAGSVEFMQTTLTAAATDTDSVLYLRSTEGLPSHGVVTIEEEHVAFGAKTATYIYGTLASPLIRGADDTTAAAHVAGTAVTTVPGSLINSSAEYNIAAITDTSGVQAFVAAPLALFRLLGTFFFLPLDFLGTNLAIISYLWLVIGIGMIVAFTVNMAGGRRV